VTNGCVLLLLLTDAQMLLGGRLAIPLAADVSVSSSVWCGCGEA